MRLRFAFFGAAVLGALGLVVACSSSSNGGTSGCGGLPPGTYIIHTTVAAGGTNCPMAPADVTLTVTASDAGSSGSLDSGVPGCTTTQNGCSESTSCNTDMNGIKTVSTGTATLNGTTLTSTNETKVTMDSNMMVLSDCTTTQTWTKQ